MVKIFKSTEGSEFSNSYCLYRFNQCYLIDPSQNLTAIKEFTKDKTIVGILLTHGHIDHITLIPDFDCPVFLCGIEIPLLFNPRDNGARELQIPLRLNPNNLDLHAVKDGDELPLVDLKIQVLFTPGHTAGSVCYLCGEHLFSGDTLFAGTYGRTDFPTGSTRAMKQSLKMLFSRCGNQIKIYPGHDEMSNIKTEKKVNPGYLNFVKQS
jgi:glyoxylase-like metal-dependent hydrolase (beta-lactamase superfamily II)